MRTVKLKWPLTMFFLHKTQPRVTCGSWYLTSFLILSFFDLPSHRQASFQQTQFFIILSFSIENTFVCDVFFDGEAIGEALNFILWRIDLLPSVILFLRRHSLIYVKRHTVMFSAIRSVRFPIVISFSDKVLSFSCTLECSSLSFMTTVYHSFFVFAIGNSAKDHNNF